MDCEIIRGQLNPHRMAVHFYIQYGCLVAHEELIPDFELELDNTWTKRFFDKWKKLDKFFDEYDRLVVASD